MGIGALSGTDSSATRYFIVGGAGFIGSHFTDHLLALDATGAVTLYDNFSSGREWHYAYHDADTRFSVIKADVKDLKRLTEAVAGHDVVIHLASNPDIARAATEPAVDFDEGTLLTHNVLEAMREAGVERILYASGSGIYGDLGEKEIGEDHGPLVPISTYGASKLAGEALISAYCHMFGVSARVFRFGNVVGPRQTHGVGFDFVRRLLDDGSKLDVLGDGSQSKSYIYVTDVVSAVLTAHTSPDVGENFRVFNVATGDYITVREIAGLAVEVVGLPPDDVAINYQEAPRGWKGDVPVVRLNTDRIMGLGWTCEHSSRDALKQSMTDMLDDAKAGKL